MKGTRLLFIALFFFLATTPMVVAVPPPEGHDAEWVSGWNARDTYVAPATQPTTQPSSQPTVRIIQPQEDIVAVLMAATSGQSFALVAHKTYSVPPVQLEPKEAITLDATDAIIDWPLPPVRNGPTACMKFVKPGSTVIGGTWTTNAVLAELYASTMLRDLTMTDGGEQAVKVDEQFGHEGAGSVVSGCHFGVTYSVTVFSTQPFQLRGCTIKHSLGEVGLRVDCTNPGGVAPSDVIIDGNTIESVGGTNLKGCTELRMLGARCQFTNNVLHDYVRIGQGTAASPVESADGLLVRYNKWPHLPPTSIRQHLMLIAGNTVTVDNNDFLVDATMETASISAPSAVTFMNNRRHLSAAGIVPRPKLWNPTNVRPGGVPTDGGGNVVIPFPN